MNKILCLGRNVDKVIYKETRGKQNKVKNDEEQQNKKQKDEK